MDIVLPYGLYDRSKVYNAALEIGYKDAQIEKFYLLFQHSDYDVYESTGDARIEELLLGLQICEEYLKEKSQQELQSSIVFMMKYLMHHTLHLWFSNEWNTCNASHKMTLINYFSLFRGYFDKIGAVSSIWDYLEFLDIFPWRVEYIQIFLFETLYKKEIEEIEAEVDPCTPADEQYFELESLPIVILRLIVLSNTCMWRSVKTLTLRILAAWNKNMSFRAQTSNDMHLIPIICHIHLMATYADDDNRGFFIDNIMHSVRFYMENCSGITSDSEALTYSPACLIAETCKKLNINQNNFFSNFAFNPYDQSTTTVFGIVSEAYISYLLGNILMELMNKNEDDFNAHFDQFKKIVEQYVEVRERSERFLINGEKKILAQVMSHATPNTLCKELDLTSLICKGNRASNICEYKAYANSNNKNQKIDDVGNFSEEHEQVGDPVFQNIPNNENVLSFVYTVLSQRKYNGWHFAKIALLLKIIGHKTHMIETWRYHPGLTTDFMLNLERNLAGYYADLAIVFSDHQFMEQEFWLTAFYLNPCNCYFKEVKRCGSRIQRQRQNLEDDVVGQEHNEDNTDNMSALKFELLSSTIDVKSIVNLANPEFSKNDYELISDSLQALRLPSNIIKDLITVIFQARNKSFAWALEWRELRLRCKNLIATEKLKRQLVEQQMAEANDRLKYLEINYDEYKDRPQLDYGTIEQGYEGGPSFSLSHKDSGSEDDDDFDLSHKKSSINQSAHWKSRKYSDSDETDDEYYEESQSTRKARAKTAKQTIALKREPEIVPEPSITEHHECLIKRDFDSVLESRDAYKNETPGFGIFVDVWDFDKQELEAVECKSSKLLQCSVVLEKYQRLKKVKSERDPTYFTEHDDNDTDCTDVSTTVHHDYDDEIVRYQNMKVSPWKSPQGIDSPLKGLPMHVIKQSTVHKNRSAASLNVKNSTQNTPRVQSNSETEKEITHMDKSIRKNYEASRMPIPTPSMTETELCDLAIETIGSEITIETTISSKRTGSDLTDNTKRDDKRRRPIRPRRKTVCHDDSKLREFYKDSSSSDECDKNSNLKLVLQKRDSHFGNFFSESINVTKADGDSKTNNTKSSMLSQNKNQAMCLTNNKIMNVEIGNDKQNSNVAVPTNSKISLSKKLKRLNRNTFGTSDLLSLAKRKLGEPEIFNKTNLTKLSIAASTKPAKKEDSPDQLSRIIDSPVHSTTKQDAVALNQDLFLSEIENNEDYMFPSNRYSRTLGSLKSGNSIYDNFKDAPVLVLPIGEPIPTIRRANNSPKEQSADSDNKFKEGEFAQTDEEICVIDPEALAQPVHFIKSCLKSSETSNQFQKVRKTVTFSHDTNFGSSELNLVDFCDDKKKYPKEKRSNKMCTALDIKAETENDNTIIVVDDVVEDNTVIRQPVMRLRELRVLVKRVKTIETTFADSSKPIENTKPSIRSADSSDDDDDDDDDEDETLACKLEKAKARKLQAKFRKQELIRPKTIIISDTSSEDNQPLIMLGRATATIDCEQPLPSDVENEQPRNGTKKNILKYEAISVLDDDSEHPLKYRIIDQTQCLSKVSACSPAAAGIPPAHKKLIREHSLRRNPNMLIENRKLLIQKTETANRQLCHSGASLSTSSSLKSSSLLESPSIILSNVRESVSVDPLS